jgi:hypothetical protein
MQLHWAGHCSPRPPRSIMHQLTSAAASSPRCYRVPRCHTICWVVGHSTWVITVHVRYCYVCTV